MCAIWASWCVQPSPPELPEPPVAEYSVAYIEPDLSEKIVKTLLELEGGCHATGQSGETGCFQYLSSTWNTYSTEILGYVAEQTEEIEREVTTKKIRKLLDEGRTPREIFLIWNQGHHGQCKSGINRHGVAYDSCSYAERGVRILGEHDANIGNSI